MQFWRQGTGLDQAIKSCSLNFEINKKVFSSPADVVKALFNQLLPSDQVACSMSSSEDAGWRWVQTQIATFRGEDFSWVSRSCIRAAHFQATCSAKSIIILRIWMTLLKNMNLTILVFSHGWSCRSSAAQTVEFPELMHLKLQPGALGRPSRKSCLTEPLPYLGLGTADLIRACQSVTRERRFNFDPRKNPPRRVLVLIPLRWVLLDPRWFLDAIKGNKLPKKKVKSLIRAWFFRTFNSFRCDEISEHLEHVHDGVIPNLHGSIIERCPMHRYGCSFYRNRLVPEKGNLKHDTGTS